MTGTTKKRTLDAFFAPPVKKKRIVISEKLGGDGSQVDGEGGGEDDGTDQKKQEFTSHHTYPFPIPSLPKTISEPLKSFVPTSSEINNYPDLELLYFRPYIPKSIAREFFEFLRDELPFYRVEYNIKRGGFETKIRTPRYTTVFGVDDTLRFDEIGVVVDAKTGARANTPKGYPRPIPKCLDELRISTEAATGCKFNFCLVNYYATGTDSISYHSDDEKFLGPDPAIASFSLGAQRDFLLKHKPTPPTGDEAKDAELREFQTNALKYPLDSGDMMLMRGKTQANWLHSIPKRGGKKAADYGGRINITFRRAMVRGGTENYYRYNVGDGAVYKWDKGAREMKLWKG